MYILVAVTFLSPVIGMVLLVFTVVQNGNKRMTGKCKPFAFVVGILFAAFGYSLTPISETDLTRYFLQVQEIQKSGLTLSKIWASDIDSLYARDALFYFVAQTKNARILPYVVGFAIYSIACYVLIDMVERSSKEFTVWQTVAIAVIMLGIIPPFSVIGNIRCVFSYVLIGLATYRDLVQKRRNVWTLCLYLIPITLHSSTVIILLIRFAQAFLKYAGKVLLIIAFSLPTLIDIAYSFIGRIGGGTVGQIIKDSISKAYYYLHWTEGGWATEVQNSLSDKVTRVYGTFYIVVVIVLILIAVRRKDVANSEKSISVLQQPMVGFLYFIAVCALGCLSIRTGAFWRFEAVVVLLSPVYLIPLLETEDSRVIAGVRLLTVTAVMMVGVNTVFQMRNLVVVETLQEYLLCNSVKIVSDVLQAFM